jgi:hypothetical protein
MINSICSDLHSRVKLNVSGATPVVVYVNYLIFHLAYE